MIVKLFEEHNKRAEELVGNEFAAGTIDKYKTIKKHIENFLKEGYNVKDVPLKKNNHQFLIDFEYYLM